MSSTWDRLHARSSVVNTILSHVADGMSAATACSGVAGVWDHFEDESHLLRELQGRWFHSLAACVDNALELGQGDLAEDVRRAYRDAADRHWGLRRILDHYASHPTLEPLVRREHALLARAAGVAHADELFARPVLIPSQRKRSLLSRVFSPAHAA